MMRALFALGLAATAAATKATITPLGNQSNATAAAPPNYEVTFFTDVKGAESEIVVAVKRSEAPLGADNFFACVQDGFYNESAFFRVVPGFVVQFGIAGSKAENQKWLHKSIKDDPVVGSNTVGTLVYADA